MLQDVSTIEHKHKKFIERAVAFDSVWILQSNAGYANSVSTEYEDTDVIPFWSDAAYARGATLKGWKEYAPVEIPLSKFLEDWLVGLHNDNHLVGTNWDSNLLGKESEPLEIVLEIISELRRFNREVQLVKYSGVDELETRIKRILSKQ